MCHEHVDPGPKMLFIEVEGFSAIAAILEVGAQFHWGLLLPGDCFGDGKGGMSGVVSRCSQRL